VCEKVNQVIYKIGARELTPSVPTGHPSIPLEREKTHIYIITYRDIMIEIKRKVEK